MGKTSCVLGKVALVLAPTELTLKCGVILIERRGFKSQAASCASDTNGSTSEDPIFSSDSILLRNLAVLVQCFTAPDRSTLLSPSTLNAVLLDIRLVCMALQPSRWSE